MPRASVRTTVGELDLTRRKDRRRLVRKGLSNGKIVDRIVFKSFSLMLPVVHPFLKSSALVIALTFQSFPCCADCQSRYSIQALLDELSSRWSADAAHSIQ